MLYLKSIDSDVDLIIKNLNKVKSIIKVRIAKTISGVVVDLLSKSQPKVPIDTGQLRESATGKLLLGTKALTIAKGTAEGSVTDMTQKIRASVLKGANKLDFDVSYSRIGDYGLDVAVWSHEFLHHYEARQFGLHPAARQPGTGPKYLELPWLENKQMYESLIHQTLSDRTIARVVEGRTRRRKVGKGKYTVEQIKITGWE